MSPVSSKRCFLFLLPILFFCVAPFCFNGPNIAWAQLEFERAPIDYTDVEVHDPIAELQRQLDSGEAKLTFNEEHGYLDALLDYFNIDPDSQVLVYSKTSFQLRRIMPHRPRALYFNEDLYLGWCQRGDVVEVMAVDPVSGPIFYSLEQQNDTPPQFVRDLGQCLTCHASSRTQGVPGPLVRSVFVDASGQPLLGSGTFTTSHQSPFDERWGGWYVTGNHGKMRHMGNEIVLDAKSNAELDRENGANVLSLESRINIRPYISKGSDFVALMVLEHQSQTQNYLTRANFVTQMAEYYDEIINKALDRPEGSTSESTERRIAWVGDNLVKSLLFAKEFQLENPISGSSPYAKNFQAAGRRDSQGRSLRDFDLKKRMFRYPCSYMIYSPCFDSLPASVKTYVTDRLWDILHGDDDPLYAHLSASDRTAILEILNETKPDLFAKKQQ